MKVLAIVLLCVFAAVQGRSAGVSNTNALAVLGENPWVVHLRVAVSSSGFLNTGLGSLISPSWVLTAADCVEDARFIWVRYGVVNVINPSLVTENSVVREYNGLALISINRLVESSSSIAPVRLDSLEVPFANLCAFGADDVEGPGENLSCWKVSLEKSEDGKLIASSEDGNRPEKSDHGAPLVIDGVQIAVLVNTDGTNSGTFLSIAGHKEWIEEQTGLVLTPPAPESSESS